jgi:hypothetical protein
MVLGRSCEITTSYHGTQQPEFLSLHQHMLPARLQSFLLGKLKSSTKQHRNLQYNHTGLPMPKGIKLPLPVSASRRHHVRRE